MNRAEVLIAVLAAGRASRFGADKLDQPCAGKPLGRWAVDVAAASGCPVVAIVGDRPGWLGGSRCEVLFNPDAHTGMASSVALSAQTAQHRNMAGLLILLADMPLIDADIVAILLAGPAPAACRYPDGRAGVPALFPSSAFAALGGLRGDQGAGALLAGLSGLTVHAVPPEKLLDVDTPADLALAAMALAEVHPD